MNKFTTLYVFILSLLTYSQHLGATQLSAPAVLELAEKNAAWMLSLARYEGDAVSWPTDGLKTSSQGYDLGAGDSGQVIYFTALYKATGKKHYLDFAQRGAKGLLNVLKAIEHLQSNPRRSSLYKGIPGIGVALMHVDDISPSPIYTTGMRDILNLLTQWSTEHDNGVYWSDKFNDLLFGDTGTVLFLTQLAQKYRNSVAQQLALKGALAMIDQAQKSPQGYHWLFRKDKPFNLPNFSHGTAGVVYTLTEVYQLTGNDKVRKAALEGANYLFSIAEQEAGITKLPYGWGSDSWKGLYEFGWAHGLAGVALTMKQLINNDISKPRASEMLNNIATTLTKINLGNKPTHGFKEPSMAIDRRFGRSGVLALLSQMKSRQPAVLNTQKALFQSIQKASTFEGEYAFWEVTAPSFMGGGQVRYTGFTSGAAGIGLALLDLHSSLTGNPAYYQLPDSPF